MICQIDEVLCLTVGTSAMELPLSCRGFLMQNLSEEAAVYFREKDADGVDCTADNGYALAPGEGTAVVLAARTLSVVASAADTPLRLLLVD